MGHGTNLRNQAFLTKWLGKKSGKSRDSSANMNFKSGAKMNSSLSEWNWNRGSEAPWTFGTSSPAWWIGKERICQLQANGMRACNWRTHCAADCFRTQPTKAPLLAQQGTLWHPLSPHHLPITHHPKPPTTHGTHTPKNPSSILGWLMQNFGQTSKAFDCLKRKNKPVSHKDMHF